MKKLLEKNKDLYEREYKREVLKIEENFSKKAKETISMSLKKGKTFDDIYQNVQHLIQPDIPIWLFKEYLQVKNE